MSETILTPIMTSNTEPSGKCNASSQLATNCEAFQAFRQTNSADPSGYYNWIAAGNVGNWISYEFDTPKKVIKLIVWNMNTSVPRAVKTFIFQGSNDGQNFTDIKTCSIESSEGGYKSTYTISSEAYRIYRLYITEVYDSDYTAFGRIDLIGDSPRIKSSGSTEAIRDWLNASLYNKEEIDELFIRNNQAGLIPYDLMITGDQPEQMIKLVGQTSGKTYNICLAAILGEMAMDRFNINEYETQGKFLDGSDICGWAVPFFKNGAAESNWSNSGSTWTNSEINSNTIDDLLYAFVINQDQQGNYSFGTGAIQWNKSSGNFTLNFSTSYNTWIMLIYTKP